MQATPQPRRDGRRVRDGQDRQDRQDRQDDAIWMALALDEARRALERGEVPVGAVVVRGGEVLARAGNEREARQDPTAHAEVLALRAAAAASGHWRLDEATLYVTLEPCAMCAGALVLARVARVVFGAADPKAGAVESVFAIPTDVRLNHRVTVTGGVQAEDATALLQNFFSRRR